MKTRTDLLNHLAKHYNLQRYLEIGVQDPKQNFDKIICCGKIGVDPSKPLYSEENVIYQMTSDEFFKQFPLGWPDYRPEKFDLIFIDGLHTAEQVQKDFENAFKILSPNGFIVLHDCNPEKEEHTIVPRPKPTGHWHGDVYKFACELGFYFKKFNVVNIDCGCGVWRNNGEDTIKDTDGWDGTWEDFIKYKSYYLNLISWDEFITLTSHV